MASEGKTVNTSRREGSGIMVNEGGRWEACRMILKESIELLILLLQGKQSFSCYPRRSRGHYGCRAFESIYVYGGNAGKPYNRPYGRSPVVKVLGRKAAFQNCARRAPPQPSARRAVKPENPLNLRLREPSTFTPAGRSILRTFLSQPFYTTCLRQQAITCGKAAPPLNPPAFVTILYCYLGPFPVYYTKVTHG